MKAILLAAGKGTRISRMIQDIPKSTLPVEGEPLIRRNVKLLLKKGIHPIVCVGYSKSKILEALEGLDVKYYYNPFYNVTNSIASLWFARQEFNEDTIIMNADVFFTEEILESLIESSKESVLMIDKNRINVGDFFLKLNDGCICGYGKDLPLEERSCEYVGLGKIKKCFAKSFIDRLESLVEEEKYDLWWENVLYSFSENNKIFTLDVEGRFWCEIDYFDDYERILQYVKEQKSKEVLMVNC